MTLDMYPRLRLAMQCHCSNSCFISHSITNRQRPDILIILEIRTRQQLIDWLPIIWKVPAGNGICIGLVREPDLSKNFENW